MPRIKRWSYFIKQYCEKSIAGIIHDKLWFVFETYLSQYTIYIGQQALLFSQLQGIAEVYKNYGSLNDPQSYSYQRKGL